MHQRRGAATPISPSSGCRTRSFRRWPTTDPEYDSIDGFAIKRKVDEITAISRKSRDDGNQYWGRITGTLGPGNRFETDSVNIIAERFEALPIVSDAERRVHSFG